MRNYHVFFTVGSQEFYITVYDVKSKSEAINRFKEKAPVNAQFAGLKRFYIQGVNY
jgi:hypothetical protein